MNNPIAATHKSFEERKLEGFDFVSTGTTCTDEHYFNSPNQRHWWFRIRTTSSFIHKPTPEVRRSWINVCVCERCPHSSVSFVDDRYVKSNVHCSASAVCIPKSHSRWPMYRTGDPWRDKIHIFFCSFFFSGLGNNDNQLKINLFCLFRWIESWYIQSEWRVVSECCY